MLFFYVAPRPPAEKATRRVASIGRHTTYSGGCALYVNAYDVGTCVRAYVGTCTQYVVRLSVNAPYARDNVQLSGGETRAGSLGVVM